jgi:predicted TPR repeat methyltransferase
MTTEGSVNRDATAITIEEALHFATTAHRGGDLDAAEALYRRILEADPRHPETLNFLALLLRQQRQSEEAMELLRRAVAAAPEYASAHTNLGNLLIEALAYDEAEAHFRRVLAISPNDPLALNNLGNIRRRAGHLEAAIELFQKAIEIAPEFALPYENLGLAFMHVGDIARAHDHFCHAVILDPALSFSRMFTGVALTHLGRIAEAREHYRKWCEDEPSNPIPRHLMATVSEPQAVPERASDDYVKLTFDNFAQTFDVHLQRLEYQAPQLVADAAAARFPARGTLDVLDAGCGTGLCAPLLKPYARRLVGIDLSPGMLAKASANGHYDALVESELTAYMAAHARAFDLVVCVDTLCYFGDLAQVAAGAARALRADGWFVFSLEAAQPGEAADRGYAIRHTGRYCHQADYVFRTLAAAGLAVRAVREEKLRMEAGKPVSGLIVSAQSQI